MREGLHEELEIGPFLNEEECQKKGPFFTLSRIATELDKRGRITSRPDRKAVIGMAEGDLIKIVAENPQNASDEHQENLCSIISEVIRNHQLRKSDEQKTPETDSKGSSSRIDGDTEANDETEESLEKEVKSAEQEARQVEDGNGKESGVSSPREDSVHSRELPPPGLYIPMLNEDDRRCLEYFLPFVDGNPRRMKRILNAFNVSRHIAELRCGASNPILRHFTTKILKMVILLEQWPYRMAWLLQFIEDVQQMSTHSVEDSRMNRFLEGCFGRDIVLPGESWWDKICRVGILEVYRRIVCEFLMSYVDSSNMVTIDSDPQLFEGLLRCNGPDKQSSSEGPYAITVHDLRPLGCSMEGGEYETCLLSYMFNMPQGITDKVSIMMNKALINYVGKNSSNSGVSEDLTGSAEGGHHAHGTSETPPLSFDCCDGEDDSDEEDNIDDSSEISGNNNNNGGGSIILLSCDESDDEDDGDQGGESQNLSKSTGRDHIDDDVTPPQKKAASKTSSRKRKSGNGDNKTMTERAAKGTTTTMDQLIRELLMKKNNRNDDEENRRMELEEKHKDLETKLYLAERFKRMSDALGSRVEAAFHCPEFKCFLSSDERSELEERELV